MIEWDKRAVRDFKKIDKPIQKSILKYLNEVKDSDNPRLHGKPLKGNFSGLWRYRINNHRVVCQIQDSEMIILVVAAAHRSVVYV